MPMAAIMMTVDNSGIKGTEWILRGSLGDVVVPLQRVQEAKLMKATLHLKQLAKVKFLTVTNPTGGGGPEFLNVRFFARADLCWQILHKVFTTQFVQ